jgi:hypothetical protein
MGGKKWKDYVEALTYRKRQSELGVETIFIA